jgi:hypothetical protein
MVIDWIFIGLTVMVVGSIVRSLTDRLSSRHPALGAFVTHLCIAIAVLALVAWASLQPHNLPH